MRAITLMNDYSVAWSLRGESGPLPRDELDLSAALSTRLEAWARTFDEHFGWDTGWDSPEVAARHAAEAHAVRRLLAEELGPECDVRLDLWEA